VRVGDEPAQGRGKLPARLAAGELPRAQPQLRGCPGGDAAGQIIVDPAATASNSQSQSHRGPRRPRVRALSHFTFIL
jgi:hypothetical protein